MPRQGVGAADHADRHLPPLLPARPARQLGQLPAGDRRRGAAAAPPRPRRRAAERRAAARAARRRPGARREHPLGSNAYGVGSEGTRDGRSVLLGNPHFPWQGSERWYELHLTVPGKLDAIGAALQGVPVVNIGFNRHVAFSHTVSTARRFTPYELKLKAGRPDDLPRRRPRAAKMRRRTVRVRTPAGVQRHTFYETRWGPVLRLPGGDARRGQRDRLRARRRQRGQLPAHQPVGRVRPGPLGRRPAPRLRAGPGQPVGQRDRRRPRRPRLLRRRLRGAERRRRAAAALRDLPKAALLLSAPA